MMEEGEKEWKRALLFLSKGPSSTLEFLNDHHKTNLFAYKSQAIMGPCSPLLSTLNPADPAFMAKQKAWTDLGNMPRNTAKKEFLKLLDTHIPNWRNWYHQLHNSDYDDADSGEAQRILQRFYGKSRM